MNESLTEQIKNYLQNVQLQLAEDIVFLKGKFKETMTSLFELTKLPSLKKRPQFWFLLKRLDGIEERLRRQRGEFLQYEQAELKIETENPQAAIKILTELADSSFSVWDVVVDRDVIIPVQGTPNPPERFHHLKELRNLIYSSQEDEFSD